MPLFPIQVFNRCAPTLIFLFDICQTQNEPQSATQNQPQNIVYLASA